MELLRAGEAFARSSLSLQTSLPRLRQSHQIIRAPRQRVPQQICQYQLKRSFTVTGTQNVTNQKASAERARSEVKQKDMSAFLDQNLDFLKHAPTNSPSGQQSRAPARFGNKGPSSVDDILGLMGSPRTQRQRQSSSGNSPGSLSEFANFLDPSNPSSRRRGPIDPNVPAPPPVLAPSPIKLGPSVGRTVTVDPARGYDVARAFRQLEMNCNRNGVRRHFMRQRFHERPGLKRKRLASERWRRRFKEGFKQTVKMVQKLKNQGW